MDVRLLGGLRVLTADGTELDLGGPKQRAILAILALDPGHAVSPARVIELVWGDDPPTRAEVSVQAYVSNLRRVLEPERAPRQPATVLVTQPAGYLLAVDAEQVDVTRFEALAASGHRALADGRPEIAVEALDEALAVWTGPLLPELAAEPWVVEAATRLDHRRGVALEDRFEAGLRLGEHRSLLPRIEAAVADHPYRERLQSQLALALYRSGRQRDALASLQAARRVLVEAVGVDPGPELRRLEAQILEQSPELDLPVEAPERRQGQDPGWQGADRRQPAPSGDVAVPAVDGRRPFVGRVRDLSLLRSAAAETLQGTGRPVVVSGEPGIGKTRLVEELLASANGLTVAWARCSEQAEHAAYWPCIQIGRQLEGAGALAEDLVQDLLPDSDVVSEPSDADRITLTTAIARALGTASRPVAIVIDDVQWADPASLRVVEFVAAELRRVPVLFVVTCRPLGPDAPPALVDCLAELARHPDAVRIDLTGLDADDVARWVTNRSGGEADPRVGQLVHGRTGGNPFFVGEVVELLASEDRLTDPDAARSVSTVPGAVHDVIRRRVSRLSATSQQLLATAAVIGRSFDLDVVAAVIGSAVPEVLDALDAPMLAGLVDEAEQPGRFQFSHALVADALAAEHSAVRRARIHAATAEALARLRDTDLEDTVAALAHHAYAGLAAGTGELAYDASVRAALAATQSLAHEEAAEHWGRAAAALEHVRPGDRAARSDALLEMGRAHLRADDVASAYRALVRAVDQAIALGDPERTGRAAAAMHLDGLWFAGEVPIEADVVGALERALAVMPPEPTPDRAAALGALGENAYWVWPPERLDAISAEAVGVARATGDPATIGRALHKRNQTLWRAGSMAERRLAAGELLAIIDSGDAPPVLAATGLIGIAGVAYESADIVAATSHLARAERLAAETGAPPLVSQIDFFQVSIHAWHGRFAEAQAALDRAYELYRRTRRWAAEAFRDAFAALLLAEQGDVDGVMELAPHLLDSPYRPWFQEGVGFALTEAGRLEEARALLDPLPPMVDCWLYLGVLTAATHSRVALADHEAVATLRDLLAPHAGLLGSMGTGVSFGDVDLALARAHHLLGDPDEARRAVDRSVRTGEGNDGGPWLARSLLFRAELTGSQADHARAAALVAERGLPLVGQRL